MGQTHSEIGHDISEARKGGYDLWVIQLDNNWAKIWDRRYGGNSNEYLWGKRSVLQNSDGSLIIGANTQSSASGDVSETKLAGSEIWIIKIASNGELLWENLLLAPGAQWAVNLSINSSGGYTVGSSGGIASGGDITSTWIGGNDVVLFKLDKNGNKIDDKLIGELIYDGEPKIAESSQGNQAILIQSSSGLGNYKSEPSRGGYDLWLVNFDSSVNRSFYASDPDGDSISWSISGGSDASKFTINSVTGELTLNTADFENPQDADSNNSYEVNLRITDAQGLYSEKTLNVYVEDAYEPSKPNHTVDLNSSVNLEMIWVEPGTFTMGSPVTEVGRQSDREDEHNVSLTKGFFLGKYEVTQAQYEAVMKGNSNGLSSTPSQWSNNPNRPVEKVSWDDVQIFLTRLNEMQADVLTPGWSYTLPTESQWEYASRAGTTTKYSWGNDINPSHANYDNNIGQTSDIGQYAVNPWGFFDMQGNVWEWTADLYQAAYPTDNPAIDPTGPTSGSRRVPRGGSWSNDDTRMRSAKRGNDPPNFRSNITS